MILAMREDLAMMTTIGVHVVMTARRITSATTGETEIETATAIATDTLTEDHVDQIGMIGEESVGEMTGIAAMVHQEDVVQPQKVYFHYPSVKSREVTGTSNHQVLKELRLYKLNTLVFSLWQVYSVL